MAFSMGANPAGSTAAELGPELPDVYAEVCIMLTLDHT